MPRNRLVDLLTVAVLLALVLWDLQQSVSIGWYIAVAVVYLSINALGATVLSLQYFVPVRSRGVRTDAIALTFDDGPVPGKTEKILALLQARGVQAAFFCIGHRVVANPRTVAAIHAGGHLLGNHSYWHGKTFDLQTRGAIAAELQDTDYALTTALGRKPRFFRPPYGVTNPMVAGAVRRGGYTVVGWSVRSFDTVIQDRAKLLRRITQSLKGGDIVLFHDYSDCMLDVLPAFLDHVAKVGLKVVRVDELLQEKAYE
ncbi:polysaccharide deacetylase family protein [Dawidia soli]|uniref:Polysaccharide deacetylase family protein n=1 Tax=Dawidia soli TaxID=2782352 RepID=A0AAP2D816_9BACT|nr:polysaccharide deacetylase family protein [Dawidia soli]MBT1685725.1 polysaccharide deacetylase family protein [Dawidia soli]